MIASLEGKLASLTGDGAIINVGGLGFYVQMPAGALSLLGAPGAEVKIYTHLHVREDNVSLFGFSSTEEQWLFETLIGVSGLGPRLALATLSVMTPEQITTAIATGSTDMLTIVPGIGKKVASRIILELKEKIGAGWIATPAAEENADVLAALTSLGYSAAEAVKALATLPRDTDFPLEDKIKTALQYLAGR